MLYTAKIQNSSGDELTLTGVEATYQVLEITGLNPPNAQINTTTIVGMDGALFNSSKLETRNLVLRVKINGDIETNRLLLYNYFRTKDKCTFFYSNNSRDVSIDGYVESVECNLFGNDEQAQISIICPFPYFKSLAETQAEFTDVTSLFVFPFSINEDEPVVISNLSESGVFAIYNSSESETGVQIIINFNDSASSIEIQNTVTGDSFQLSYSFLANDTVIVNTNKGKKSVSLIRNGVLTNLFSALIQGSVFFQLSAGSNTFEYQVDNSTANNDKASIIFKYYSVYRGV